MGSLDYYEILDVDRSATDDDLRGGTRTRTPLERRTPRLSSKTSPKPTSVLSDATKRAVYDQIGEEGLKGPPQQSGGNVDDIFAEFFGDTPLTYCNNARAKQQQMAWDGACFCRTYSAGDQGVSASGGTGGATMVAPPPVESKLACTLEELYMGVTKKMKISRNVFNATGTYVPRRMKTESETLSIEVKPGWKKGTKITFPGKGNQQWN